VPLESAYIREEDRLDITFDGNLDFSLSSDIFRICKHPPNNLRACTLDLSGVNRVFDSGVALLQVLSRRLAQSGTTVVLLTDHPEITTRVS
jgi:ABC-type transporter Mla MlaB component